MKKPLVIIAGPTAVGKTDISIKLAKQINGEIISADSVQVYKYMDVGSAKIKKEEMQDVKHYMIDELEPDEEFNVFVFLEKAKAYIEEIYAKNKIPIIVGGTGFYIQSIIKDIDFVNEDAEKSDKIKKELEDLYDREGEDGLFEILKEIDYESSLVIHKNNVKRVQRAILYYKLTGKKISIHNEEQKLKKSPYNYAFFVLNNERQILYNNIDKRVDNMIDNGLIIEVENLLKKGYSRELTSMQALGYKEIISYLNKEISLEEAIFILKRDTRHFAKRQLTWFRREKDVNIIDYSEFENKQLAYNKMLEILKEKRIIE